MAVSLSVATATASLPIAWQLYLTEDWAADPERRMETGVPKAIRFQTNPQIALAQIQRAVEGKVPVGVLLADEIYGSNREFRDGAAELKLDYSLAVRSNTTVWALDRQPLPPRPWNGKGRPAKRMRRDQAHQPITVKQLAQELPEQIWSEVAWREGSKGTLQSRFAALRVRPAYGDDRKGSLRPEQWLLIEWPKGTDEPSAYWLSNLAEKTRLKELVGTSKHRWVIERDYEEAGIGTRTGALRRPQLAGISSPRHPLHCGLRLLDRGKEPFFPLSPRRPSWATRQTITSPVPAAGGEGRAPNGITRIRSPLSVSKLLDRLFSSFRAALCVVLCEDNL